MGRYNKTRILDFIYLRGQPCSVVKVNAVPCSPSPLVPSRIAAI